MADDRTVSFSSLFPLTLRVEKGTIGEREYQFMSTFRIGRSDGCDVHLLDRSVSKNHAEIQFIGREWWVQDLESRNGTYLNGVKIQRERLPEHAKLELGLGGPVLSLIVENLMQSDRLPSPDVDASPMEDVSVPDANPAESIPEATEESHEVADPLADLEQRLARAQEAAERAEHRQRDLRQDDPPVGQEFQKQLEPDDHDSSAPPPDLQASEPPVSVSHVEPLEEGREIREEPQESLREQDTPYAAPVETAKDSEEAADVNPSSSSLNASEGEPSEVFSNREPLASGSSPQDPSVTQFIHRYLQPSSSTSTEGDYTRVIKGAYNRVRKQHARRYLVVIGVIAGVSMLLAGVAWYQYLKVQNLKTMAAEIFYAMKAMELKQSQLEDLVLDQVPPDRLKEILNRREKIQAMQQEYDRFLEKIGIYSEDMSPTDRHILKVARLFGECEIGMPPDFMKKVKSYINKWRSTDRLETGIRRAMNLGYGAKVSRVMIAEDMPPQFFYVALQESGFDHRAVGPKTRFGIAKGPWQFIPTTAVDYGLSTGPLVDIRKYDPRDERHDFDKATQAAARYLKDIYSTEAQASGLLVMASYNWGQTRVRKYIQRLPPNPKERNFWQLLKHFKIPQETYDYVFYIFSAAVIAENPEHFGFDFKNPLPAVE